MPQIVHSQPDAMREIKSLGSSFAPEYSYGQFPDGEIVKAADASTRSVSQPATRCSSLGSYSSSPPPTPSPKATCHRQLQVQGSIWSTVQYCQCMKNTHRTLQVRVNTSTCVRWRWMKCNYKSVCFENEIVMLSLNRIY